MSEQPCNWCNRCRIGFYRRSAFTVHMEAKHLQGAVRIQAMILEQKKSVICTLCAKNYLVINKHLHPQNGHAPVWKPVEQQSEAPPPFACPVPKCHSKIVNRMELARHFVANHEEEAVAGLCHRIQRRFDNYDDYKEFQTTVEDCFGTQFAQTNGSRKFLKSKAGYLYCQYNRKIPGVIVPEVAHGHGKEILVRKRLTSQTCPAYMKVETMQNDGSVIVNGALCHYKHKLQICPYLTEPHLRENLIETVLKGNGKVQIDKIRPTQEVREDSSYDMKLRLLREYQKQSGQPVRYVTLNDVPQKSLNEDDIKFKPETNHVAHDHDCELRPFLTEEEARAKDARQQLEMVKLKESLKGVNKFYLNMATEGDVPSEEPEDDDCIPDDDLPCTSSSIQQVKDEVEAVLNTKPIAILPPIPNQWPDYNFELPETRHLSCDTKDVHVKAEIEDDASEYTAALNNQSICDTTVKVEIKEDGELEPEDCQTQPATSAALGTKPQLVVPVLELKRSEGRRPHTPYRPAAYLDYIGSNVPTKRKERTTPTEEPAPLRKKHNPPTPRVIIAPRKVVGTVPRQASEAAATSNRLRISLQCPKDQPCFASEKRNSQYRSFSDILFKK